MGYICFDDVDSGAAVAAGALCCQLGQCSTDIPVCIMH